MASVVFGGGVSEIRGSIGGQVFAKNANGSYIRNRTAPVNPRTTRQVTVRNNLAGVANGWRDLDDAQRNSWIAATPNFPYTNREGQSKLYTGQQLYNTLNMSLVSIGQLPIFNAPTPMSTFGAIGVVAMDASTPEVEVGVSVPPGVEWQVQAFSTGPVSPGVMRPNSRPFFLVGTFSGSALTADLLAEYTVRFGALVALQKVFWKFEAVSVTSGQRIAIGQFSEVVSP